MFPLLRKSRLSRVTLLAWLAFVLLAPLQLCLSAYAAESGASQAMMEQPCHFFMAAGHDMHMSAAGGHANAAMRLDCHRSEVATGAGSPWPPLAKGVLLSQLAWLHDPLLATGRTFSGLTDDSRSRSAPPPAFLRYSRLLI